MTTDAGADAVNGLTVNADATVVSVSAELLKVEVDIVRGVLEVSVGVPSTGVRGLDSAVAQGGLYGNGNGEHCCRGVLEEC